jgi:hypothetical protein
MNRPVLAALLLGLSPTLAALAVEPSATWPKELERIQNERKAACIEEITNLRAKTAGSRSPHTDRFLNAMEIDVCRARAVAKALGESPETLCPGGKPPFDMPSCYRAIHKALDRRSKLTQSGILTLFTGALQGLSGAKPSFPYVDISLTIMNAMSLETVDHLRRRLTPKQVPLKGEPSSAEREEIALVERVDELAARRLAFGLLEKTKQNVAKIKKLPAKSRSPEKMAAFMKEWTASNDTAVAVLETAWAFRAATEKDELVARERALDSDIAAFEKKHGKRAAFGK